LLFQRLADPGEQGSARGSAQGSALVSALVSAHVDIACQDVAAVTERHVVAGARVLARFANWTTLADPTGRPYCLTGRDPWTGKKPSP
jgi:hypothetical protein